MSTTWFDESYPPSIYVPPLPPVVPITGVTAGTPGAYIPANATPPASLADLRADPVIGNTGTNKPGAAWTVGQYVLIGNVSQTHAYWDGTGWQSGNAPAPPPEPEVAVEPKASATTVTPEEEA